MNWYAIKVKYQTERKMKGWLDKQSIECFLPFHNVMVERNGRKIRKDKPIVPGLLFIRTEQRTAYALLNEMRTTIIFYRNLETQQLLIIPDKQMADFMFLLDFSEVAVQNANLRQGDRVRVIKGIFAGIEGELVRVKGHKRVIVRLEGLFSLATTYIPGAFLERIE